MSTFLNCIIIIIHSIICIEFIRHEYIHIVIIVIIVHVVIVVVIVMIG